MTQDPAVPVPVVPDGVTPFEVFHVREGAFGVEDSGDTSGFGGLVELMHMPEPTLRPYGGWFDAVADELELSLAARDIDPGSAIEKVVVDREEISFFIRRDLLVGVLSALRDEPGLRFEFSTGVSGVHYPSDLNREFHAVYHLLSISHNRRVRVEVTAPAGDPHIPSSVGVYPTNDWHERETFDLFGIVFDGHPVLTRILMPDDWPGHPQRKDYPLGGIPVEYKGATIPPPDQRRSYNS